MQREQSYANHARYLPLYHFIVVPLFVVHFIVMLVVAIRNPRDWMSWWQVVVAVALLLFVWAARLMALTVQNRVIRLEDGCGWSACCPTTCAAAPASCGRRS